VAAVTPWALIVLRAWRDADGFKVRLLQTDGHDRRRSAVVASSPEACRVVARWLGELEAAQTNDETDA
jgi:hypothetical protein